MDSFIRKMANLSHAQLILLEDKPLWYAQGVRAAEHDFGWCSRQIRKGNTNYACGNCDHVKDGNAEAAKEWLIGYQAYWSEKNAEPRKKQVPLPEFY